MKTIIVPESQRKELHTTRLVQSLPGIVTLYRTDGTSVSMLTGGLTLSIDNYRAFCYGVARPQETVEKRIKF